MHVLAGGVRAAGSGGLYWRIEIMRNGSAYRFFLVVAITILAACATTEVTAVWKDESYRVRPHKVLIYAVLKKPINRRIVEDEFVRHFRSRGIDAIPGYAVFPDNELVEKEVLEEMLKAQGFDSLLLMQPTETRTEQVEVPGMVTYHPAPSYRTWPGSYHMGYMAVYTPGYTFEDRYVLAETNLFDVATEKLIWTAASETKIEGRVQKLIKTYVDVIMDAMRDQKIVP
jgi:hypothetical protein